MSAPSTAENPLWPSDPGALDARMRRRLAASLDHVAERIRDQPLDGEPLPAIITALAAHPVPPALFARYYDLIPTLQGGQHTQAARCLREMAALAHPAEGCRVIPLHADALGLDPSALLDKLDTDPAHPFTIRPAGDQQERAARPAIAAALELLRQCRPASHAQFQALVRQVVMVAGDGGGGARFDGGSSFMLWGALFLNVAIARTPLDWLLALDHEATHLLLYGHSIDAPLVSNDPRERYPSPLRAAPRPMDGVFHATIVLARQCDLLEALLVDAALDGAQRHAARQRLNHARRAFAQGLATLSESARPTPIGETLLRAARRLVVS